MYARHTAAGCVIHCGMAAIVLNIVRSHTGIEGLGYASPLVSCDCVACENSVISNRGNDKVEHRTISDRPAIAWLHIRLGLRKAVRLKSGRWMVVHIQQQHVSLIDGMSGCHQAALFIFKTSDDHQKLNALLVATQRRVLHNDGCSCCSSRVDECMWSDATKASHSVAVRQCAPASCRLCTCCHPCAAATAIADSTGNLVCSSTSLCHALPRHKAESRSVTNLQRQTCLHENLYG